MLSPDKIIYYEPIMKQLNQEFLIFQLILIPSDSNGMRTHNHFVCKRTLYHLAK